MSRGLASSSPLFLPKFPFLFLAHCRKWRVLKSSRLRSNKHPSGVFERQNGLAQQDGEASPGARVQRGAGRLRRPQKATGLLKHRPSRQARPALCRGQGLKPLPSDMMLCVISYWVLSGANRRQIQQLRCCVLPRQADETEELCHFDTIPPFTLPPPPASVRFCGIAGDFARWLLQTGWKSCWHPQSLPPVRSH